MPFDDLVGQKFVKSKLEFYIEAYKKTGTVPFLNFVGAKGNGKTAFAREFGRHITDSLGANKRFIEINTSTIKSGKHFFEQVFLPHIYDQEVVVFFDEAHALPNDLTYAFLTILNTEKDHIREFNAADNTYVFDFKKHHFIFGTSESDKVFIPLKDRLTTIDFEDYNSEELSSIFKNNLNNVQFEEGVLDQLAETSRGNARSCVHRAKEVGIYCARFETEIFTKQDLKNFFDIMGILPYGLNRIEWQILNILRREGQCTLSALAAKTGLTRTAIQRDFELFLLRKNFISINGLRSITLNGVKAIDKIAKV